MIVLGIIVALLAFALGGRLGCRQGYRQAERDQARADLRALRLAKLSYDFARTTAVSMADAEAMILRAMDSGPLRKRPYS